jgi:hypothetical protein
LVSKMVSKLRPKWGESLETVRSVFDANSLQDLILATGAKKARLPPREPGTARENDACS